MRGKDRGKNWKGKKDSRELLHPWGNGSSQGTAPAPCSNSDSFVPVEKMLKMWKAGSVRGDSCVWNYVIGSKSGTAGDFNDAFHIAASFRATLDRNVLKISW